MHSDLLHELVNAVERKDRSTAAHTWRVALYGRALAEDLGADAAMVDRVMRAAVLHDIGKIDIDERILAKPGRLSEAEFAEIRRHPMLGFERLRRLGERDSMILDLVRSHHERIDGSGYPDGLRDSAIPPIARWFAVIDTFDAMTSFRPYRTAPGENSVVEAIAELRRHAQEWYCGEAVDRFTQLLESGRLDWIHHHFNDGASSEAVGLLPTPDAIRRHPLVGGRSWA
jgi:putative nucleotidyltransferase with HDIG domain